MVAHACKVLFAWNATMCWLLLDVPSVMCLHMQAICTHMSLFPGVLVPWCSGILVCCGCSFVLFKKITYVVEHRLGHPSQATLLVVKLSSSHQACYPEVVLAAVLPHQSFSELQLAQWAMLWGLLVW